MLAIKFKRIGKKHQPSFRIIIAEKRSKMVGTNVEDIGWYSPLSKKFELKKDRVTYWISKGAQPTDTVHNFLVKEGVLSAPKRAVHKKSKKAEIKAEAPAATPASATPAPEAKPAP